MWRQIRQYKRDRRLRQSHLENIVVHVMDLIFPLAVCICNWAIIDLEMKTYQNYNLILRFAISLTRNLVI